MDGLEDENHNRSVIKQGYCRHRSRGVFKKWTRKWMVLFDSVLTQAKVLRVYRDEASSLVGDKAVHIPLDNVDDIIFFRKDGKSKLTIVFVHFRKEMFSFSSEHEINEWYELLNLVCFGSVLGRVAKEVLDSRKKNLVINYGVGSENRGEEHEPDTELFFVILQPSLRLKISGECLLQVTSTHVRLKDLRSPKITLVAWDLSALRRFGYDRTRFTFEAGRRCDTGEGLFVFKTSQGEAIHNMVLTETQKLASREQIHHNLETIHFSIDRATLQATQQNFEDETVQSCPPS